jgi:hypothetical protein
LCGNCLRLCGRSVAAFARAVGGLVGCCPRGGWRKWTASLLGIFLHRFGAEDGMRSGAASRTEAAPCGDGCVG